MKSWFKTGWLGSRRGLALSALFLQFCLGLSANWCPLAAGQEARLGKILLVLPFDNFSKAPGLEWIGESFPEILAQRMASSSLYAISRDDRLYAFDRLGIPASTRPSRATVYEIAREMDVDYVVLGQYNFDGQVFTATAQLLQMDPLRLFPEVSESGPLPTLIDIETALAWDLLRVLNPQMLASRNQFVSASPPIRLDAFEDYVRGIMAGDAGEKVEKLRQAAQLDPSFTLAVLQLGKTYYAQRDYKNADAWLARIPKDDALALQANFLLGMGSYYSGQFERAESAFTFVASRFPLIEVYNNLGVVTSRRGKNALPYFRKAAQADPQDPDYCFNLSVALARSGDLPAAAAELRRELALRANDQEARDLLDAITRADSRIPLLAANLPLERIKSNYDETSFRELALEIDKVEEKRLAAAGPAIHAHYHAARGRELLAQGFVTEAAAEFRRAITIDPKDAAAHSGLAHALELLNDASPARSEAQLALGLEPSAEAYVVLGELDLRERNPLLASQSADKALALQPGYEAALELKREIASQPLPGARDSHP